MCSAKRARPAVSIWPYLLHCVGFCFLSLLAFHSVVTTEYTKLALKFTALSTTEFFRILLAETVPNIFVDFAGKNSDKFHVKMFACPRKVRS